MRPALITVFAAGCAVRGPTYVPLDQPLPMAPDADGSSARIYLSGEMERGRMPALTWSGRAGLPDRQVAPSDLHTVPSEALWMAWVVSPRRMWGAELDLLISGQENLIPLTVEVGVDGSVHLRQGEPIATPDRQRTDREDWMRDLARTHGLRSVVDGDAEWSLDELSALQEALELLDDHEALLLAGLVLSRDHISPRSPRELALYDPVTKPATIHAYDRAFAAGSWSFVGPLEAPLPAPVMTLVHEFGHAISDAPVAAAWSRWADARIALMAAAPLDRPVARATLGAARAARHQVGHRGPVIEDYALLRHGRLWPTTWSTDVFESFAEAFGLWKTDPDALARVAPQAHAWFARDGHLAWRAFPE